MTKQSGNNQNAQAATPSASIQELEAFGQALDAVAKAVNPKMNIYRATGMVNQEKHHSSLFAGLLDPDNPHKLGNAVLSAFLERLYDYQTKPDGVTKPHANKVILASRGISSKADLLARLQGYVSVSKELRTLVKIGNRYGRMDVVVEIPQSQTVIVIENKTGTTTHDDQLKKYQADMDARYGPAYKKIFVYLSPQGELPYNLGGDGQYNADYCVFDYEKICDILAEIIVELKSANSCRFNMDKDDKKILIYGLEEYLDMCKTDLLNENVGKFEKCEEVICANPAAFKKMLQYLNSPREENVVEYVAKKITGDPKAGSIRMFATDAMQKYFTENREDFEVYTFHCYCHPKDDKKFNGYEIFLEIENIRNAPPYKNQWTPFQQKLLDALLAKGMIKAIKPKSVRIISGIPLLSAEDCYKTMDEVKEKLDTNIAKFTAVLQKVESILKSLTPQP